MLKCRSKSAAASFGSEGMAEGGCGGNSAMPERNQKVDSPAVLLEEAGHHRKILFSLEEKEIRRAQNEKSKEYFSVVWRACRAVAGLASLLGVLLKNFHDPGSVLLLLLAIYLCLSHHTTYCKDTKIQLSVSCIFGLAVFFGRSSNIF